MINRSSYRINLKYEEDSNELLEKENNISLQSLETQAVQDLNIPVRNHIVSTPFFGPIIINSNRLNEDPRSFNTLNIANVIYPSAYRSNPFILTRSNRDY